MVIRSLKIMQGAKGVKSAFQYLSATGNSVRGKRVVYSKCYPVWAICSSTPNSKTAVWKCTAKGPATRHFGVSLSSVKRYVKLQKEGRSLAPKKILFSPDSWLLVPP